MDTVGRNHTSRESLLSRKFSLSDLRFLAMLATAYGVSRFFLEFHHRVKKKIAAQSSTSPFAEETKRTDCRTRTVHDCPFPEDPGRE